MKKTNLVTSWTAILFLAGVLCLLTCQAQALVTLPEDTSYGTWDATTNTYTLTCDINDSVEIKDVAAGFTLDGGVSSITGTQGTGGEGNGIYMVSLSGVTVTNLTVKYFDRGIYLYDCTLCTVIDNDCSTNHVGIHIELGSDNTIEANRFIETEGDVNWVGIKVTASQSNTIHNNTIYGQANTNNGILLETSSSLNFITQNNISNIEMGNAITLNANCGGNTLKCNDVFGNSWGTYVESSGNILKFNTYSNNNCGLYLAFPSCSNNDINNNNFIDNFLWETDEDGNIIRDEDGNVIITTIMQQVLVLFPGTGNVFEYNYFNEWTTPDEEEPYGIVDVPYPPISTNPLIQDISPQVKATSGCALWVEIDIKPGDADNHVNLGSLGVVPVGILSTTDFDATTVDPWTVELASSEVAVRGKGSKLMSHAEDLNGDGLLDLFIQVETENLDPDIFQDGNAILTGKTTDGISITGMDTITIVPPEE